MANRRIYLDACCLVSVIKGEDGAHTVRSILRSVELGLADLWASPLLIAEVVRDNALVEAYLAPPMVKVVDLTVGLGKRAQKAASDCGLKGADAVHVATALHARCDTLFTTDEAMLRADGYEGLRVARPEPLEMRLDI